MNKYIVEREIAHALYGQVLLAREVHTNEHVAIKKMSKLSAASHTTIRGANICVHEDIQVEKQVNQLFSARGGHSNILRMRTDFEEDGFDYMVFDFCDGGDLYDVLSCGGMTQNAAIRYFVQIAQAVAYMHGNGIAHRDLSLENVLLHDDICYLCDFGLATSTYMPCDETVGKHYYMAPEVARGTVYDPVKADIWSLGMILFMLVTGSPLCNSATERDNRFKYYQKHGLQKLLQSWRMEVDPEALDLLEKMLAIDPNSRATLFDVFSHTYLGHVKQTKTIQLCEIDVPHNPATKTKKSTPFFKRFFRRQVMDAVAPVA